MGKGQNQDDEQGSLVEVSTVAIADTLRAERARARLLQRDVAERSGISLPTIKRYEAGETAPNVGQLMALCRAIGISTRAFLDAAEKSAIQNLAGRNTGREGDGE